MKKQRTAFLALVLCCGAVLLLPGCGQSPEQTAEQEAHRAQIKKMQEEPEIKVIGVFDGCTVKFVDRYHRDDSFFLARCGDTVTTTEQATVSRGKYHIPETRVAITSRLQELEQERQALLRQETSLKTKEAALAKLSPEERAALGIKPETVPKPAQ